MTNPELNKEIPCLQISLWEIFKSFPVLHKIKFVIAILRVMLNPNRTESIFVAIDLFTTRDGAFGDEMKRLLAQAEWREVAKERYLAPTPNLEQLSRLPEGTLGKCFAEHMIRNKLDPEFFPCIDIKNDMTWLTMRGRQIHDLLHVVTGFDTDVPAELGLQAVTLGTFGDPAAAMIVGGGLLHAALLKPWILPDCMFAIERGFAIGRSIKNPLGYKFEENWEKPIEQVRRELGIDLPENRPKSVVG